MKTLFILQAIIAATGICAAISAADSEKSGGKTKACCDAALETNNAARDGGEISAFEPRSKWITPDHRKSFPAIATRFTDQANREGSLRDLLDRPTALVFFYSRCRNSSKCSAAVQNMAELQSALSRAGLLDQVNLVMVSYEPHFDTPERLTGYGAARGIEFAENVRMLCLEPEKHKQVIDALEVPVSYNAGWVNVHGIAMYLFDFQGRLARHYHTLMWDNELAADDLRTLIAESTAAKQSQ